MLFLKVYSTLLLFECKSHAKSCSLSKWRGKIIAFSQMALVFHLQR